jgi:hypothetical protein
MFETVFSGRLAREYDAGKNDRTALAAFEHAPEGDKKMKIRCFYKSMGYFTWFIFQKRHFHNSREYEGDHEAILSICHYGSLFGAVSRMRRKKKHG